MTNMYKTGGTCCAWYLSESKPFLTSLKVIFIQQFIHPLMVAASQRTLMHWDMEVNTSLQQ